MINISISQIKELPTKIIWSVLFLTAIGLIVLKSISQHNSSGLFHNPFTKQLIFLGPGLVIAILILFIPRYTIHKYSYFLYSIGVLIVLLPFLGNPHAGTYRWLNIGLPFSLQPSEFAKVFTTIALARYLSDHNIEMKQFSAIIIPLMLVLLPTAVVINQPDLGTAIIMMTPALTMLYWSGARPFYLFLLLAPLMSMLTAFHNIAFTFWALILGLTIYIAHTRQFIALSLFLASSFFLISSDCSVTS